MFHWFSSVLIPKTLTQELEQYKHIINGPNRGQMYMVQDSLHILVFFSPLMSPSPPRPHASWVGYTWLPQQKHSNVLSGSAIGRTTVLLRCVLFCILALSLWPAMLDWRSPLFFFPPFFSVICPKEQSPFNPRYEFSISFLHLRSVWCPWAWTLKTQSVCGTGGEGRFWQPPLATPTG